MRYELSDFEWTAIKPMLPNKPRGVPRVATRYDKLAANYPAFVKLASIRIWLRANESTTWNFWSSRPRHVAECCPVFGIARGRDTTPLRLPHRRTGYLVALVLSDAREVWITFNRGRYQQTSRVNCRALMSLRRYRQVSVKAAGMATMG
jgi:hypothetical protein